MAKVSTNISIDAETKTKAQSLLSDFGMDLSTAVNIFLRQMVRDNAFPFVIQREVPNAETLEAIEEVRRMKSDPSIGKSYSSVGLMMEDLLK